MNQPQIHPFGIDHIFEVGRDTLDNGVPVFLIPLEDTRVVMLEFFFHGSKWHQQRTLQAYFSSRLMSASTEEYDADHLAEIIDYNGATIYTRTGFFGTTISLVCLSKKLRDMMPVIRSIITIPTYDQRRFSTAISMARQDAKIRLTDVEAVCNYDFLDALYGKHHPSTSWAEIEDYDTLTPSDLKAFHDKYVCSSDCQIWITGEISDDVHQLVNDYFGKSAWGKNQYVFEHSQWPVIEPSAEKHLYKPMDGVQSAICVGKLLPRWDHPDFTKLTVATTMLGGYFGSRLMTNIREKKGLTYGIQASLSQTLSETALVISTSTANEAAEVVTDEIYKEIRRMQTERAGEDELERVKNYMIGFACRRHEPGLGVSKLLMTQLMKGFPIDHIVTENNIVRQTTADDIMEITNKYFDVETMTQCVVGNAKLS